MSAFEHYQKQKKKKSKKISSVTEDDQITASTPLPQESMFAGIAPSPSSGNVFLGSPIPKFDGKKHAKHLLPHQSSIDSASSDSISLAANEKHKHAKKKTNTAFNFSVSTVAEHSTLNAYDMSRTNNENEKTFKATSNGGSHAETDKYISHLNEVDSNLQHSKKKKKSLKKCSEFIDSEDAFQVTKVKPSLQIISNCFENSPNAAETASLSTKRKGDFLDTAAKRIKTDVSAKYELIENSEKPKKEVRISSVEKGKSMLGWILHPVPVETFFQKYWEKQPLYISREDIGYYEGVCSLQDLNQAFRKCPVYLLKNVTVTAYKDGVRTTDNNPGRARPSAIWDMFANGHSIRVLNPQTFVPNVGMVVATLQEFFRNMVGVNSYLTPAGTQGFAPHYDDIEAFVLQMEGEKHWKVYPPRSEDETLPQLSSPDLDQAELGAPILEVTLKAGDLLYFPRGWIHQARSVEDHHSLHLTVSTYQCNSWGDYFKKVVPLALETAIATNVKLREGLPLDFLDQMGVSNKSLTSTARSEIKKKAAELFSTLLEHCPWDEAADQLGMEFIHSSFPQQHDDLSEYSWAQMLENPSQTMISLISANVCRISALEDDRLICYYSTDNSLEPKGEDLLGFEISEEDCNVIQRLRTSYPKYVKSRHLLSDEFTEENLADLLAALAQRGIINVKFLKKSKKPQK